MLQVLGCSSAVDAFDALVRGLGHRSLFRNVCDTISVSVLLHMRSKRTGTHPILMLYSHQC